MFASFPLPMVIDAPALPVGVRMAVCGPLQLWLTWALVVAEAISMRGSFVSLYRGMTSVIGPHWNCGSVMVMGAGMGSYMVVTGRRSSVGSVVLSG